MRHSRPAYRRTSPRNKNSFDRCDYAARACAMSHGGQKQGAPASYSSGEDDPGHTGVDYQFPPPADELRRCVEGYSRTLPVVFDFIPKLGSGTGADRMDVRCNTSRSCRFCSSVDGDTVDGCNFCCRPLLAIVPLAVICGSGFCGAVFLAVVTPLGGNVIAGCGEVNPMMTRRF